MLRKWFVWSWEKQYLFSACLDRKQITGFQQLRQIKWRTDCGTSIQAEVGPKLGFKLKPHREFRIIYLLNNEGYLSTEWMPVPCLEVTSCISGVCLFRFNLPKLDTKLVVCEPTTINNLQFLWCAGVRFPRITISVSIKCMWESLYSSKICS